MGPLSTKYNVNGSTASDSQNRAAEPGPGPEPDSLLSSTDGQKPNKDNSVTDFSNHDTRIYYAVHIPLDSQIPSEIIDSTSTIFEDKQDALKLVKKYKRARFKAFDSLAAAALFTVNGATCSTPLRNAVGQSSGVTVEDSVSNVEPLSLTGGEKPSPFKGPKSQDLVRLRKAIESGDVQYIQKTVWENPRYLVSSGDTPSILHEGSRYNALHVCAKSNKAVICSFILKTICDVDFIKRLYGDNSESVEAAEDRCKVLLDLYLNTPDKGFNETPLHFAVKHGSIDVVRVLVSYSQCDKTTLNKFKQAPKDIICSRVSASGDNGDLYKKILMLLEEQYFIPVLRSQDPSIQPTIGQPFSASKPLHLSGDIKSPAMEVQGVAGPMPLDTARTFRRRWKTPPRDPVTNFSPVLKTILQDPDKGLEKVGRDLAEESNVCWMEYWSFLNTFANFRTEEGRDLLENYLMKRFKQGVDSTKPSHSSDVPCVKSPVSELCDAFRSWRLSSGGEQKSFSASSIPTCPPSHDKPNHMTEQYNGIVQSDDLSVAVSPHLYIEKSCQVFTKRIADGLLRFPDAPGEPIACEVIYLNMLVTSCLNDSRFASVNFARLHGRIAACLIKRFSCDDRDVLVNAVDTILKKKCDLEGSSSEEEASPFRERDVYRRRIGRCQKASVNASVRCIARHILNGLSNIETTDSPVLNPPSTEEDCNRLWLSATPCDCVWSLQQLRTRQSLRRNNYPSAARKIDFSPVGKGDRRNGSDGADDTCATDTDKTVERSEESAGEESDTSDNDCGEFFTPPSSPRDLNTPVSSEDDFAMESPDEGPDVYIDGDVPTSLDNAVLDALGKFDLNPAVYPNICRWKLLVTMHSAQQRERWPSPRRSNLSGCGSYSRILSPSSLL